MNKAVFLDRDKTIIEDEESYLNNPAKVKLLPEVARAIKKLNKSGFKVIVVTNQSGVGRNYFTENDLKQIHQKMVELLQKEGANLDDIFYCPHHPEDRCACRKPLPGLIVEAVLKHNISVKESYFVGDSQTDIEAGKNAGCKTILIKEGGLEEAVTYILSSQ
jgi:histidinol-phosphate phosphatase family protein